MSARHDQPVRHRLRASLQSAIKARDHTAIGAFRSALGAIDNAEAVEASPDAKPAAAGPVAGSVIGLGAGEVPRRHLADDAIEAIVSCEAEQRRSAALEYEKLGRPDHAARLRAEAALLEAHLSTRRRRIS
jgi:uncharacterized protein YqeY